MVAKLRNIKLENFSSGEEKVNTMELGQEAKKTDEKLYCEKNSEVKRKVVEDKFDAIGLVKLLLKDF